MLTENQDRVLRFVAWSIKKDGFAPSITNAANALGLPFTQTRLALLKLDELGYIKRQYNIPRAIQILRWPDEKKVAA